MTEEVLHSLKLVPRQDGARRADTDGRTNWGGVKEARVWFANLSAEFGTAGTWDEPDLSGGTSPGQTAAPGWSGLDTPADLDVEWRAVPTSAVWLSSEVSRWAEPRPGLRSVVLLAVRPVAQDVVDLGHHVGRHLRKDLSSDNKIKHTQKNKKIWKSVTGSEE